MNRSRIGTTISFRGGVIGRELVRKFENKAVKLVMMSKQIDVICFTKRGGEESHCFERDITVHCVGSRRIPVLKVQHQCGKEMLLHQS